MALVFLHQGAQMSVRTVNTGQTGHVAHVHVKLGTYMQPPNLRWGRLVVGASLFSFRSSLLLVKIWILEGTLHTPSISYLSLSLIFLSIYFYFKTMDIL